MYRQVRVDGHAALGRDRAAHQIIAGSFAVHAPGQGGVASKSFLIEEIAPAAAALPQQKAHGRQIEHGQHRHAAPLAGKAAEQKAADDAAVDGKTAVADGDHLPDALIFKRCHGHIVGAGADNAQHDANQDHIHHAVRVHAELDAVTEREHQRQTDAERNAHTIPVNAESTDGKGHAVELKAQAKARELYQICHSASSSSSASGAVPSGWIYMTAMRSVLRMCCSAASASSAVRPASMAICWATVWPERAKSAI